jgi:hypothetical protein
MIEIPNDVDTSTIRNPLPPADGPITPARAWLSYILLFGEEHTDVEPE